MKNKITKQQNQSLMQQSKKSLKIQKTPLLQKDLSFSNQIFKKSLHQTEIFKSNKSSQSNITNHFIPPLIKYTQNNLPKQNIHTQISPFNNQISENQIQQQSFNIFTRTKHFANNLNDDNNLSPPKNNYIPPLSTVQLRIQKKYQKSSQQQKKQSKKPQNIQQANPKISKLKTTVYLDKTDKLGQGVHNNNSHDNEINIDSLQESRIANKSIQRQNNWVLQNQNNSIQQDGQGQNIIKSLNYNKNQRKNFVFNNQSFRKINPLNLISNSLHSSNLPEFVDDDDSVRQNNDQSLNVQQNNNNDKYFDFQKNKVINNNQRSKNILQKRFQTPGYINNNVYNQSGNIRKQKSIYEMTMGLFNHYIPSNMRDYINYRDEQGNNDQIPNSILIDDGQQSQKLGFDKLTSKSSPIYNNQNNNNIINQNKSISETVQQLSRLSPDISIQSVNNNNQHFIHDKNSHQILSCIINDRNKLFMFVKYLQLEISIYPDNCTLIHNYQLLSCTLIKILSISHQSSYSSSYPQQLTQSILQLFSSKNKSNQSNQSTSKFQQTQPNLKSYNPQIIRSNNTIKIDFDPYLKYQKKLLNQKISYLKKSIQQKNKATELIKLTYDGIIHNYAITLQNLAKKAENHQLDTQDQFNIQNHFNKQNQFDKQKQSDNDKQQSIYSKGQMKSNFSQTIQMKGHLDIANINRSSMQNNKIHRKATFGKVPSSFRGSGVNYYQT